MKPIRSLIKDLFHDAAAPNLTEHSSLLEIAVLYPEMYEFIERKYGLKIEPEDRALSLKNFTEKFRLPPAPVVFMEIQLDARDVKISEVQPKDLHRNLLAGKPISLLDVRENWEIKMGRIHNSVPLTASLLDEILTKWQKDTEVVLYCHHGIRSADAAVFLVDRGFKNVSILKGGIDAWSTQVEPGVARYQGAYC